MPSCLLIADLINTRSAALGLKRGDLARLCGYSNISKGMRRLDELCRGDLHSLSAKAIIAALPHALKLHAEAVERAIATSDAIIQEVECKARETHIASLVPSAWLLGERSVPSPIVAFGITGGSERWLRIKIDATKSAIAYAVQAQAVAQNAGEIPFVGKCIGFIVNYTANKAVRFDLSGNPVETFEKAYVPGHSGVFMGNRRLPYGYGFYS